MNRIFGKGKGERQFVSVAYRDGDHESGFLTMGQQAAFHRNLNSPSLSSRKSRWELTSGNAIWLSIKRIYY